ncbi:MAG: GNAT family N-acetyltransferase [Chitinophagaceae bacterium]|jgi:ribosomal protein S18 acetylase RimI-like enzyme|nr:GNAT family N-acetyltransferase [Chitinophagaceae bacterium]
MLQLQLIQEEGPPMDEIRTLFRAYETELNEDLCFQSFEAELKDPLKKYGPPKGVLYLALWNEVVAGCIALFPLNEEGNCEMKRLYVRPAYRKHKIGKALVDQLLHDAHQLGYSKMKLDTLQKLQPAIALYKQYGFIETTAYYHNPLPGVVYMEKELTA